MRFFYFFTLFFVALFFLNTSLAIAQASPFFAVSPTKAELWLAPGETGDKVITIANNLGGAARFTITVEDYVASGNGLKLLGQEDGVYSLKYYIQTPQSFVLGQGEKYELPITISLPANAPINSLHAAVVVEGQRLNEIRGAARVSSRIAVPFFIRVEGEAKEQGKLQKFALTGGPIQILGNNLNAYISFKNFGTTYLNPYGYLEIKNLLSQKVMRVPVDPWFILPKSTRTNDIELSRLNLSGLYSITLYQNRGYGDLIDSDRIFGLFISRLIFGLLSLLAVVIVMMVIMLKFKNK